MTGLRIVQSLAPFFSPDQFSYSGAVAGTIGDGGILFQKLGSGLHTVTQAAVPGHPLQSIDCSGLPLSGHSAQPNVAEGHVTVNLSEGDVVTCVFTNFGQDLPHPCDENPDECEDRTRIIVEKQTIPDADPGVFSFSVGGVPLLLHDGEAQAVTVAPGTHTVVESARFGWRPSSIACSDGAVGILLTRSVSINVSQGETVRCTFTNVRDPWDPLVQIAVEQLIAVSNLPNLGSGTRGFYSQIRNIICAAALSPRASCDEMSAHYPASHWATDAIGCSAAPQLGRCFVFRVFDAYLRNNGRYASPAAEATAIDREARSGFRKMCRDAVMNTPVGGLLAIQVVPR